MTARTVDILLDRCSDLQAQRDRAVVQRAGYESHLWHAECLLKQLASLLPRMTAATPADSVAADSLREQIVEFINEARHHPGPSLEAGSDGEDLPVSSGPGAHDA